MSYKNEDLAFVIPFTTDHGRREDIFNWNVKRLEILFPGAQICIGEQDQELFNLSAARNNGIRQVDREYLFSLDADTVWNRDVIADAVRDIEFGGWSIPYNRYLNIDMESGTSLTSRFPGMDLVYEKLTYCGDIPVIPDDKMPPVSGIVGMHTDTMYQIGGFDERFSGWGHEDRAFAFTAEKLLGPPYRRYHNIYHIWHEVGPTINQPKYHANWDLLRRYENEFEKVYKKFI